MKSQNNKFNFFVPVNDIEKGVDPSGNETYRVKGLISDSSWDSDGESLDYNGFDFSEFQYINWDHKKEPVVNCFQFQYLSSLTTANC